MTRQPQPITGPVSRRFDVASVGEDGKAVRIEFADAEREALSAECGLPGIDGLVADLEMTRQGAGRIRVSGRVRAQIRQVCVVSLDEFATNLDETVDVSFAPAAEVEALAAERARRGNRDEDEQEDLPDPIVGGRIDLGALVAESVVLALDPYPKKPGVVFADIEVAPPEPPAASPFAMLGKLKGANDP